MKIRTELSLLALALELLLAAITSGDVHASTPSDPAPIVQGYQRLPRDPAQPPAKAGKALTLGVNLHPGQVVRICPGTSQSPTPAAVGNPRALLAPHPGLIELDGVCKQILAQPVGPTVGTAPTRSIQPGAALTLIDPDTAVLSRDNSLDVRPHGLHAQVTAVRDAAYGRYLLIDSGDTAAQLKSPLHFVLDQQGHFIGITLVADQYDQSLLLVMPYEALSNDPKALLQAGMAFPEVASLVESMSLERNRDWAAMAQHARRWLRTANTNVDASLALAIAADNRGDRRDAIKAYEKVVERVASHPQALMQLAPLYAESGQIEAAADTYLKAIQILPEDALLHRSLGMVLLQLAAYHEAIEHLERATALDKSDKLAWNALGVGYQALMHGAEADDAFKRAIELDNTFYGAWLNLAALKHEQGDHAGAHAAYCEAAKRDPSSPVPWFGRGLLYAETGQLAREIGAYQRALQLKPDDTKALYNLGKAYLLSGQVLDAIDTYETLRSLDPGHVDTLFNLGLAYFLNGENNKVEQVHLLIRALSRAEAEIFYLRFLAPVDRYLPQKVKQKDTGSED